MDMCGICVMCWICVGYVWCEIRQQSSEEPCDETSFGKKICDSLGLMIVSVHAGTDRRNAETPEIYSIYTCTYVLLHASNEKLGCHGGV